ncbi:hypothetical protein IFM89_010566 [Coptis chinensis]|uniref:Uncharacterized protein n=1 Tax=Coptis chinensis TaxID=261450 RepID=A0A835ILD1_9MAGN|nr:hypothetical protein IFM89_010566 [Coptis chinensis]
MPIRIRLWAALKAATQTQGVRNVEVTSLRLEAVVFGYYSPASTISCGGASLLNSDAESSPRGNTLDVENFYLSQSYQSGDQDEEIDRRSHGSYGLLEAKGSLDALNLLNDSNRFADTLPGGTLWPLGLDCQINARILSGNKEAIKRTLSYCGPQSDEYAAVNQCENEFAYNLHREATFHEPYSIYKATTSQLGRIASEEVEDASSASFELCDLDDTNLEIKFGGKHAFSNP